MDTSQSGQEAIPRPGSLTLNMVASIWDATLRAGPRPSPGSTQQAVLKGWSDLVLADLTLDDLRPGGGGAGDSPHGRLLDGRPVRDDASAGTGQH